MLGTILSAYPCSCQPTKIESLGNAGGFSGAGLWRVATRSGDLCLRRWPREHPSSTQLAWIHSVQTQVHRCCAFIPELRVTTTGNTFLQANGHLWELSAWMPGAADFKRASNDQKLRAAMTALAEFHIAAAEVETSHGSSGGLGARHEFCTGLNSGQLDRLKAQLEQARNDRLAGLCRQIYDLARPRVAELATMITTARAETFRLQPCLRDIWHDHVLFQGDNVVGIIDFGAMRVDTVAGDIARLLGSLIGDRRDGWLVGLAAYEQTRPLQPAERSAIRLFDLSNVVLSGFNWIRWLFVDGTQFPNLDDVQGRLMEIYQRLQAAC